MTAQLSPERTSSTAQREPRGLLVQSINQRSHLPDRHAGIAPRTKVDQRLRDALQLQELVWMAQEVSVKRRLGRLRRLGTSLCQRIIRVGVGLEELRRLTRDPADHRRQFSRGARRRRGRRRRSHPDCRECRTQRRQEA
jgi:hypothetical protein